MDEEIERRPFELHFRLGSIPVVVEPVFWFSMSLFGLMSRPPDFGYVLVWLAIAFFAVLVHELGHALVARLYGSSCQIRLHGFGGVTIHQRITGRWRNIAISLAGPGAGFVLGGLIMLLEFVHPPQTPLAAWFLSAGQFATFWWGVFNLIPVVPLDGGHVLANLLGERRERYAYLIGGAVAAIAAVAFGMQNMVIAAFFFGMLAFRNFQASNAAKQQRGIAPEAQLSQTLVEVMLQGGWKGLSTGDEREAARLARAALEQAATPELRNRARDLLAWAAMAEVEHARALTFLDASEPPDAARPLTRAMVLDAMERRAEALPFALAAVEREPSDSSAALALRLLLEQGRIDEADALASRHPWKRAGGQAAARARLSVARSDFTKAAADWQEAFERSGSPEEAYNAACAHARAGRVAEAVAWLERALDSGFRDLDALRADPDLAEVRQTPELQRLLAARAAG